MPATPDDELASAAAAVQAMDSLDRRLEVARRQAEASAGKAAAAQVRVAAEARVRDRIIATQKKVEEARAGVREFQTTLPQRAHRCTDELARLDAERVVILSLPRV